MTFPIVLAHGVCRFDKIWSDAMNVDNNDDEARDNLHYFKGIRTMLTKNQFSVHHSNVSWASAVDTRADDLRKNILRILEKENCQKVNIIAHSMGGLDARHMMFNDRNSGKIHRKIASLTTISTPHWGSEFADWGTDNLPDVIPMARRLGLDIKAFEDLRTDRCKEFNENAEVVDFEKTCEESILFQTYAGRQDFLSVFNALKLSYYIIERKGGDNDGLVTVASAKWRDRYFKEVIENADHLNELGWWDADQIFCGEGENELLKRIHKFYLKVARNLP